MDDPGGVVDTPGAVVDDLSYPRRSGGWPELPHEEWWMTQEEWWIPQEEWWMT